MASLARLLRNLRNRRINRFRFQGAPVGSANWLAGIEDKYGGKVRVKLSASNRHQTLYPDYFAKPKEVGGDRMSNLHHGYGESYQEFLKPFVKQRHKRYTICEIGILCGTGLALWCDLFPNSRIIGLDFELCYFNDNLDRLSKLGAFSKNSPEVYQFDQYACNAEVLNEILNGDMVDICIDDACHQDQAILNTLRLMSSHLKDNFVYFVEDNWKVHTEIGSLYKHFYVRTGGMKGGLTIITNSEST